MMQETKPCVIVLERDVVRHGEWEEMLSGWGWQGVCVTRLSALYSLGEEVPVWCVLVAFPKLDYVLPQIVKECKRLYPLATMLFCPASMTDERALFLSRMGVSAWLEWSWESEFCRDMLESQLARASQWYEMARTCLEKETHLEESAPVSCDVTLSWKPYREAKSEAIQRFEYEYSCALLRRTGGNISHASRLASMDRANFRRLLRRHNLLKNPGS
jgi:hypothetical protein